MERRAGGKGAVPLRGSKEKGDTTVTSAELVSKKEERKEEFKRKNRRRGRQEARKRRE